MVYKVECNILKSFDSDGFTLGTSWGNISNNDKYVGWNWKAGNKLGHQIQMVL